jgi:hypothetical protein
VRGQRPRSSRGRPWFIVKPLDLCGIVHWSAEHLDGRSFPLLGRQSMPRHDWNSASRATSSSGYVSRLSRSRRGPDNSNCFKRLVSRSNKVRIPWRSMLHPIASRPSIAQKSRRNSKAARRAHFEQGALNRYCRLLALRVRAPPHHSPSKSPIGAVSGG